MTNTSRWIFRDGLRPKCAHCGVYAKSEEATPYCSYCGYYMSNYAYQRCTSFRKEFGRNVCYGTKEREECTCGGNKNKCNFYSKE